MQNALKAKKKGLRPILFCTFGSSGSKAFDTGKSVLLFPGEHTKKCMLYAPCLKAWVLLKRPAKARQSQIMNQNG